MHRLRLQPSEKHHLSSRLPKTAVRVEESARVALEYEGEKRRFLAGRALAIKVSMRGTNEYSSSEHLSIK